MKLRSWCKHCRRRGWLYLTSNQRQCQGREKRGQQGGVEKSLRLHDWLLLIRLWLSATFQRSGQDAPSSLITFLCHYTLCKIDGHHPPPCHRRRDRHTGGVAGENGGRIIASYASGDIAQSVDVSAQPAGSPFSSRQYRTAMGGGFRSTSVSRMVTEPLGAEEGPL